MAYKLNVFTGTFDITDPLAVGSTISGLTEGSILFGGVAGVLAQDNANLFYNNASNVLQLAGATSVAATLAIYNNNGTTPLNYAIQITDDGTATGNGYLFYVKTNEGWLTTNNARGQHFAVNAVSKMYLSNTGHLQIASATASNATIAPMLNIIPTDTTTAGITLEAPTSYNALALNFTVNGTQKWAVDKDGYITNATNVFRFKRNDSTTAYLELLSSGTNGYGAVGLSGTEALGRSSTGVDFGDIDNILNLNFRGATVNFFTSNRINLSNSNLSFYWNNNGLSWSNNFQVGVASEPPNTNYQFRVVSLNATRKVASFEMASAQSANALEVLATGQTVPGFGVDSAFKLQWGDGAGTAVDTNLYRSAASILKTDDEFQSIKLTVSNGSTGVIGSFTQSTAWNGSNYALSVSGYSSLNGFRVNGADAANSIYLASATMGFSVDTAQIMTFGQWNGGSTDERIRVGTSIVINEPGNDYDFRVEGDTNANLFFVDASTDRVGIGTNAPAALLHVSGVAQVNEIEIVDSAASSPNVEFRNTSYSSTLVGPTIYPSSGTNIGNIIAVSPRGTGTASIKSEIIVFGTDYVASPGAYEFCGLRATGTSYIFAGGQSSGTLRPFIIAGDIDNPLDQLFVSIDGKIGIRNGSPSALLTIGTAGSLTGTLSLAGVTSGTVTVTPASAAGTWTLTLPTTGGTDKYFLQTNGSGTSTWAAVTRTLFDHYADAGNIGAGEDDLYSDTIAASQLGANGDKLEAYYSVVAISGVGTRRVKVYFGGTAIYDSGANIYATNQDMDIRVHIIRESSTVVRATVTASTTNSPAAPYAQYTRITGLTLSNTSVLKITGESGDATNDDIVAKHSSVKWVPAA